MNELELKPCPFCGGEANLWHGMGFYRVLCSNRRCCANNTYHSTEEGAITAWNSRYIPEPKPLTLEEWHEDYGDCLWWRFPIEEPPYCGKPIDSNWPGYHTHFTRIVVPSEPRKDGEAKNQS